MKKIVCFFFLLYVSFTLSAQDIDFRNISIDNGLSNFVVNDIGQDSHGFLWIATEYGLNRFDGKNIKIYNKITYPQITNNWINCLHIDNDDIIWIGTNGGGILKFDPRFETFVSLNPDTTHSESIEENVIKDICADNAGNLWVGTSNGLFRLEKSTLKFTAYYHSKTDSSSLSNNFVNTVHFDSKGRLWVGTWNGGLNVMNAGKNGFFRFKRQLGTHNSDNSFETIATIFESKDGTIWAGTWGSGAYYFNERENRFINFFEEQNLKNNDFLVVRSIYEDSKGNMYFGAFQKGLYIFNKISQTFTFHEHKEYVTESIGNNNIQKILEDKSNVLWIGTMGGGLSYYDITSSYPKYYKSQQGSNLQIQSDKVSAAIIDRSNRLWITTYDKGLNIVDEEKQIVHSINSSNSIFSGDIIFNLIEDNKGFVWLAAGSGLYMVDEKTLKLTYIPNIPDSEITPVANDLSEIYVDYEGIIWLGYFAHGISSYDPKTKKFQHYLHDNRDNSSLTYNPINCFLRDKEGILWIGMELGLGKFNVNTKQFTFYQNDPKDKNSIPEENIQSIFEDKSGILWVGTHGGGLIKFDRKALTFTQYTVKDGLSNDVIKGISADKKDRLWLATGKGISIFDKSSGSFNNLFDNFGFKPVFYNNISVVNDSTLIFAGGGVCRVNTNSISLSTYAPDINIVNLSLFNKPVKIGEEINGHVILDKSIEYCDEIELSYKENVFTLDFAALHFSSPLNIKYKYKLEGFDNDWYYTDALKARATYTNLKGGTYTFIVYASNADGIWTESKKELKITIIPPFWQTVWFRILLVLSIIFLILIATKWIIRKEKLELEKKQADQEHEIMRLKNENLQSEIKIQAEKLLKKSSDLTSSVVNNTRKNEVMLKLKTKLETVSENVNEQAKREIGKLIREIKQDLNLDENWDQFEIHFNEVHNNFIERLKKDNPDLTPANLKMCAYLRMNLSSKEIATLLNISVSGVEKSRYRLRKKLQLETEDNLTEFIMNY